MTLGRRAPETVAPEAWLAAGGAEDEPPAGARTGTTPPQPGDAPLAGCRVGLGGAAPNRSHPASHRPAVPMPISVNSARRVMTAGSVTWRKVFAVGPQRLEVR